MIIVSPNVVLSPSGDIDSNNPVIGYDQLISTGNIEADSSKSAYPVTNLANHSTTLRWESDSSSDQYITATVNATSPIDYLAIARHNFGTEQATLSVEAYNSVDTNDDPEWEEIIPEFIPSDDKPILTRWDEQAYTGVRLKIQLPSGADVPYIGVMYIGKLLVIQRRVYVGHTPLSMGRKINAVGARSVDGNFLGKIILGRGLSTEVSLQNLTASWFRSYMDPFFRAAQEDPFFFAWRPGTYPNEVGFAWMTNGAEVTNQSPNGMMQASFEIEGFDT